MMGGRQWLKWLLGLGMALALHACGGGESGAWERARMDSLAFEGAEEMGTVGSGMAGMELSVATSLAEEHLMDLSEEFAPWIALTDSLQFSQNTPKSDPKGKGDPKRFRDLRTQQYCNYAASSVPRDIYTYKASSHYNEGMKRIMALIGFWEQNITILESNVEGAVAINDGTGAYILVNPEFFKAAKEAAGDNDFVYLSVIAHELGHHINRHFYPKPNGNELTVEERELEADKFSGWAMSMICASAEEAQLTMRDFVPKVHNPGSGYPDPARRLQSILSGFRNAPSVKCEMEKNGAFLSFQYPDGVHPALWQALSKAENSQRLADIWFAYPQIQSK